MALEDDGFIFLAEDEKDFFFFGDAGHGLIDDLERFESLRGGVQLSDAAIDKD